jgi:thiosulfate reductase cytochrome b subunit
MRTHDDTGTLEVQTHPAIRRAAHWLQALSIFIMVGSGWRIYNASPIFPFNFPETVTLGGDGDISIVHHNDGGVANAIAWHFAGMWLLLLSVALYLAHGLLSGHFRRDFLPVGPKSFFRDFIAAATFRLGHKLGEYNAVQRVFYLGVIGAIIMMFVTGLAIWKPVQLQFLTGLFFGFQGARLAHFLFMAAIVAFIGVHLALVAVVPKTLVAMITGRATAAPHGHPQPQPQPGE